MLAKKPAAANRKPGKGGKAGKAPRARRERTLLRDRGPLQIKTGEGGDSPQLAEYKRFANRLLAYAKAHSLSQVALARVMGSSTDNVRQYLEAEHQPGFDKLRRLGEGTGDAVPGASLDWLVFGDGGNDVVKRGDWRTGGRLSVDVATHVRRELQASGHSQYAVDHYLPDPDTLLALAVEAARKAAVDEYARRRTAYFWEVQRIASRYAHGFQRADGFVAMAAAPTAASSMTSRWAEILANGAAEPDSEEFPLYDAGEALPALAELLVSLSPADSPAVALVLQGESPGAFFWRMAGRVTLEGDSDEVLEHRQSQPEAPIYERAAEWCLAQRWEKSPDKHFQGHTRWVWSGPVDASAPTAGRFAVWARSQLAGVPDQEDSHQLNIANCAKVAGPPDKPGLLAS